MNKLPDVPCPEEVNLIFFDSKDNRHRIMKVQNGHNGKYLVTDSNLFFGFDMVRFTHWSNLPENPS